MSLHRMASCAYLTPNPRKTCLWGTLFADPPLLLGEGAFPDPPLRRGVLGWRRGWAGFTDSGTGTVGADLGVGFSVAGLDV